MCIESEAYKNCTISMYSCMKEIHVYLERGKEGGSSKQVRKEGGRKGYRETE